MASNSLKIPFFEGIKLVRAKFFTLIIWKILLSDSLGIQTLVVVRRSRDENNPLHIKTIGKGWEEY